MEEENQQIDRIETITKCSMKDQKFYRGYMKRASIRLNVNIMNHHRKLLFKLKEQWSEMSNEELSYAALILANKRVYAEKEKILSLDFSDLTLEDIRNLTVKKIELHLDTVFVRNRPKREELLAVWGDVKLVHALNKKGISSFVGLSRFLLKHHKIKVVPSTIHRLWKELEENDIKKEKK